MKIELSIKRKSRYGKIVENWFGFCADGYFFTDVDGSIAVYGIKESVIEPAIRGYLHPFGFAELKDDCSVEFCTEEIEKENSGKVWLDRINVDGVTLWKREN